MVANNAVGDEVLKSVHDACAHLLADDSFPKRAAVPVPVADASDEFPATRVLGPPARARTSLLDPDPWVDEYELLKSAESNLARSFRSSRRRTTRRM